MYLYFIIVSPAELGRLRQTMGRRCASPVRRESMGSVAKSVPKVSSGMEKTTTFLCATTALRGGTRMQQGRRHASSASLESLRLTRNRQRAKIVQKESTPRNPTPHLVKCAMRERPLEVLLEAHPARNALWESGLMTLLLFVKNVRRGQSAGRMIHGPCASPAAPQRPRRARRVRPGAFGVRRERKPATPQRCASLASRDDFVRETPWTPRLV